MRLRTGMLVGIAALVAAIVAATVAAVILFVGRSERAKLTDDLARSRRVFEDLLEYRHSVLRSDCRVIANEPRLRAMVATRDISRETVIGVVAELKASLGTPLFLLTDGRGMLVADAADANAEGFDLTTRPGIAAARDNGEGSAVWISGTQLFQVQACRVDFGEQRVGIVVVGRPFDDAAAGVVHTQTGSTLSITIDGVRVAGSAAEAEPSEELRDAIARAKSDIAEATIAGTRIAATAGVIPRYEGKRTPEFLLFRSLDEALAPGRALTMTILLIAAVALIAAMALAFAISRRLSRPVDDLVQFTRRVGQGDLAVRAAPAGATEVRALASAMNQMVGELEKSREQLAHNERLQREMEIAMRIQTSILPPTFDVNVMQIAATMLPATEVGGDYYDVLPIDNGCWIGIGDVAGHGLTAGLEMLMVQSVVSGLVRENPNAAPRDHVCVLNQVIYENVRNRLKQDEHITFTLLRYAEGKLVFAGAHEDIVVLRKGAESCECIPTPGTWLGGTRDISRATVDTTIELGAGDLIVLYSDGITEARSTDGLFGLEGLCAEIEKHRALGVDEIRDHVIAAVKAWQTMQDDDISLIVARVV